LESAPPPVLIADDDSVARRALEATLTRWGYEVLAAADGLEAWRMLQGPRAPRLAIFDWVMPRLDGLELCRRIRATATLQLTYVILLTANADREDVIAGLEGGADDYVTKPFDLQELRARVQAGLRVIALQRDLAGQVEELRQALSRVKQLQGLLPICCHCKKIRDDRNYWLQVEAYLTAHTEAQFSHGICPDCLERVLRPEIDGLLAERSGA
jgi:DNA-binding response OmpR family regulator